MSPGDLGRRLKPFVFLDLFDIGKNSSFGFGLHPHSGIATVTHLFEGSTRYQDTTGATGILPAGGVEWLKAGGGAWHGGGSGQALRRRGFQLWIALPPEHELGPVESINQTPEEVARDGPASVLVGAHGGAASALKSPAPLNYLALRLKAGESWRYQPPAGHTVAWMALAKGSASLAAAERVDTGELVVFEPTEAAIDLRADVDAELVIGSAPPHPHDLVLGYHSVHSSPAALMAGERQIGEIGARLQKEGRLPA
jgi:redox-sensitive bicupin YhaK (pirin superfamily)